MKDRISFPVLGIGIARMARDAVAAGRIQMLLRWTRITCDARTRRFWKGTRRMGTKTKRDSVATTIRAFGKQTQRRRQRFCGASPEAARWTEWGLRVAGLARCRGAGQRRRP